MKEVVVLGGPNGAGKTTASRAILFGLGIRHFVNADEIAHGLSPIEPAAADIAAGRLVLMRIRELTQAGESFALETTAPERRMRGCSPRAATQGTASC